MLIKYLHPKPTVIEHIRNYAANERLHELVAVREERKTRQSRTYDAVIFKSPTLQGAEVYCATRYVKVTTAGRNIWANNAPKPLPPPLARVHQPRDKIIPRM